MQKRHHRSELISLSADVDTHMNTCRSHIHTCCAGHTVLSLHDLLHCCPALPERLGWDLDNQSLSSLLATSHAVRSQVSAALQSRNMVCCLPDTSLCTMTMKFVKKLYQIVRAGVHNVPKHRSDYISVMVCIDTSGNSLQSVSCGSHLSCQV